MSKLAKSVGMCKVLLAVLGPLVPGKSGRFSLSQSEACFGPPCMRHFRRYLSSLKPTCTYAPNPCGNLPSRVPAIGDDPPFSSSPQRSTYLAYARYNPNCEIYSGVHNLLTACHPGLSLTLSLLLFHRFQSTTRLPNHLGLLRLLLLLQSMLNLARRTLNRVPSFQEILQGKMAKPDM